MINENKLYDFDEIVVPVPQQTQINKGKAPINNSRLYRALEQETPVEAEALIAFFKNSDYPIPDDSLHTALRKGWTTLARAILTRTDLAPHLNRVVTVTTHIRTPIIPKQGAIGQPSDPFTHTNRESKSTPLYEALLKKAPLDILVTLITKGADIEQTLNPNLATVLHFACQAGWTQVVDACLSRNYVEYVDVDVKTKDNLTPLHLAAENGHAAIVGKLLFQKADINAINEAGDTPLSLALKHHRHDIIRTLSTLDNTRNASAPIQAVVHDHDTWAHEKTMDEDPIIVSAPIMSYEGMMNDSNLHEWSRLYTFEEICIKASIKPKTLAALKLYAHIEACRLKADPTANDPLSAAKINEIQTAIQNPAATEQMIVRALKMHRSNLSATFSWAAPDPLSYTRLLEMIKRK